MPKLNSLESKSDFAARVGLTKGRISQLVAEGLPVRADGQIDVAEGLAWIETTSTRTAAKRAVPRPRLAAVPRWPRRSGCMRS